MMLSDLIAENEDECTPHKRRSQKRSVPIYYRSNPARAVKILSQFGPKVWTVYKRYATEERAWQAFDALKKNGTGKDFWQFSITGKEK
jgi:hypothetical protein